MHGCGWLQNILPTGNALCSKIHLNSKGTHTDEDTQKVEALISYGVEQGNICKKILVQPLETQMNYIDRVSNHA